jgi:hypothetical protein
MILPLLKKSKIDAHLYVKYDFFIANILKLYTCIFQKFQYLSYYMFYIIWFPKEGIYGM